MLLAHSAWIESTERFAELGFKRRRDDTFVADGVTMTARDGWLTLRAQDDQQDSAPTIGMLGQPGLWKPASSDADGQAVVCDLPLAALLERLGEAADDDIENGAAVGEVVRWALQTRPGCVRPPWDPPSDDLIDTLLPAGELSVNRGPYLEKVSVIRDEGMLSLRIPLCRGGEKLSGVRRTWLGHLLADGRGFRMVRVGARESAGAAISAELEIDLSGAPQGVLEALLPTALDALRACFSLLVVTAAVISDPQCASRALDQEPTTLLKLFTTTSSKARR
jgi:hypothetical protein